MNLATKFRLRHGALWRGKYPSADELVELFDNFLLAACAVAILVFIYWLVGIVDSVGDEKAKVAQHEQILSDCLSSRAVFQVGDQLARCRVEWVR